MYHTQYVVSHLCAWGVIDGMKGFVPIKVSLVNAIEEDRQVMMIKIIPTDEVRDVKKTLLDEIYLQYLERFLPLYMPIALGNIQTG